MSDWDPIEWALLVMFFGMFIVLPICLAVSP